VERFWAGILCITRVYFEVECASSLTDQSGAYTHTEIPSFLELEMSAYVDQYAKVASHRYAELVNKRPAESLVITGSQTNDIRSVSDELEATES